MKRKRKKIEIKDAAALARARLSPVRRLKREKAAPADRSAARRPPAPAVLLAAAAHPENDDLLARSLEEMILLLPMTTMREGAELQSWPTASEVAGREAFIELLPLSVGRGSQGWVAAAAAQPPPNDKGVATTYYYCYHYN